MSLLQDGVDWVRARIWLLIALAAVAILGLRAWSSRAIHPDPGVLVATDPVQGPPAAQEPWKYRDHRLTSLASFELQARILGVERYRWDRASEISPLDLALGWGRMSDSSVLDRIRISQDGRWYYWSTPDFPIPEAEITAHSANMHMIPANHTVQKRLQACRPGQVIHLRGQLVHVVGHDQWTWRSSLSRTDTGDGACEVVWVESAELR